VCEPLRLLRSMLTTIRTTTSMVGPCP
jgi:hypothetical protein